MSIQQQRKSVSRSAGRLPFVATTAVDMATEGQTFPLWVPARNEAFEGANTVTTESQNPLENTTSPSAHAKDRCRRLTHNTGLTRSRGRVQNRSIFRSQRQVECCEIA